MSISPQLPPIPLAVAGASLRALAQAAGQTVEARVLGQAGNGTTQVQIGRQVLTLNLPQSQPAGTTLTLSVRQADGQLQLTLEGVRPPAGGTASVSSPGQNAPATQVQLSATALSGGPGSASASAGPDLVAGNGAQAAPQPNAAPRIPGTTQASPSAPYGVAAPPQGASAATPPGTVPVQGQGGSPPQVSLQATAAGSVTSQAPAATGSVPVAGVALSGAVQAAPQAGAPSGAIPAASGVPASPPPAAGSSPQATAPQQAGSGVAAGQGAPAMSGMPRAEIPYAVAAPASAPGTPVIGVAGSASTALPPVGQTVSTSIVGQHAPPPNMATVSAARPGQAHPVPTQAPSPATPQAALAQMVQQALPRQDSIVGLTSALTAAVGKFALPEPVAKAAQQVLGARVPLDGAQLSGAALKTAVQRSGIFQEALLASGRGNQAAGDTKSALLGLRQSLGAWLRQQAPVAQVAGVAPPLRGLPPRARAGDGGLPALPDDMLEAGKIMLERTEAALSRLRLHQSASLPEQSGARQDTQWSLDLPVMVASQQHLLQMQIHQDPEGEGERPEDRGWQIRFAINLSDAGEIGAQISLRTATAGVLLWADQPETAAALAADVEALKDNLAEIGLKPGAVVVRTGAPVAPAKPSPTRSGQHLDATR